MIWTLHSLLGQTATLPLPATPTSFTEVVWGIVSLCVLMGIREFTYWATKLKNRGDDKPVVAHGDAHMAAEVSGAVNRVGMSLEKLVDAEVEEHRVLQLELQSIRETCGRIERKLEK